MLATTSAFIRVTASNTTFGTIPPGETTNNARYNLELTMATNAPTGVQYPFTLALSDGDGNNVTLVFNLACIAQLSYLDVAPRTNSPGGLATFTAYFRKYAGILDDGGIASVKLGIRSKPLSAVGDTVSYLIDLPHVTSSTGVFQGAWTIPTSNDWSTILYAMDTFGHTNVYANIISGGFSSMPYDSTCGVLFYNDYQVKQDITPLSSHALVMQAIANAGVTYYYWDSYYRGAISDDPLSHRPVLFYYPILGCSDLPTDTPGRRAIQRHLDAGGKTAILNGYTAYAIYNWNYGDPTGRTMLARNFGCAWVTNFSSVLKPGGFTKVLGTGGDPIGNGMQMSIASQNPQDELFAVAGGIECFRYDTNSSAYGTRPVALGTAGVRTSNTVFLAWFGQNMDMRECPALNDLIWNILSYFNAASPYVHGGNRDRESDNVMATRTLQFHWGGFDAHRLAAYNVALGTAPDATDAMDWTLVSRLDNTYVWSNAISPGLTFYARVRALDDSGAVIQGPVASAPLICLAAVNAIDGDYDGDRLADPALYRESSGEWTMPLSSAGYGPLIISGFGGWDECAVPGDYDGDRKADPTICLVESGAWFIRLSSMGSAVLIFTDFGGPQCLPASGDYDGDGRTDPAIYDTTSGLWSVMLSGASYRTYALATCGSSNQLPVTADFDGDGRTDPTLYDLRSGTWTVRFSGADYAAGIMSGFGGPGWVPLVGDLDADGKADPCIYQAASGIWYVRLSTANYATVVLAPFGDLRLTPVLADYDGDRCADIMLYDPSSGAWTFKLSSANYAAFSFTSGGAGYAPVQ